MKRFYVYLFAALLPIMANAQYDDDMYFGTSSKKSKTTATSSQNVAAKTEQSSVPLTSTVSPVTDTGDIEVYNKTSRDEDEYNRRYNYSDYQGTLEQAIDTLSSDVQYVDDDKNSDYDINDDESDYRYSRRILRFHSPHVGVIVSSPYYWDLVYDYGAYDFLYADYYTTIPSSGDRVGGMPGAGVPGTAGTARFGATTTLMIPGSTGAMVRCGEVTTTTITASILALTLDDALVSAMSDV